MAFQRTPLQNGLVDAFEFLTALALASGLRAVDKIVCAFVASGE